MIGLSKYAVIADVWAGSAPINEDIFKANGVEAMIIRMNNSWGGLEYDTNFLTEWGECKNMKRAAYVVVSPLNVGHTFTAKEYVDWILAKKPTDCTIIALDVEVDAARLYNNPTITPQYYSTFLVGIFTGLHAAGIKCIQYSGAWFYAMVKPWVKPDYVDQWWARYVSAVQPTVFRNVQGNLIYPVSTWPALMDKIGGMSWTPLTTGFTEAMTGRIVIWQVTSVWVLPGCPYNQPVDVNVMLRTDFERIFGTVIPPVAPPVVLPPVVVPPTNPDVSQLKLSWPCDLAFKVGQKFGEHPENYVGYGLPGHEGLDFLAPSGCSVFAMAEGVVEEVILDTVNPYGVHVQLRHHIGDLTVHTIYAHLRNSLVMVDGVVGAGQLIAISDNTGNSTGPHLHITVKVDGYKTPGYPDGILDPYPLVVAGLPVLLTDAQVIAQLVSDWRKAHPGQ